MSSPHVPNKYVTAGDGATNLLITRRNGEVISFLLDDESVGIAKQYTWSITSYKDGPYAATILLVEGSKPGRKRTVCTRRLHRLLVNAPDGMHVDHISGDTTDNRLNNIRVATRSQNMRNRKIPKHNSTGYKGVIYRDNHRTPRKYCARIGFEGKKHHLGYFLTPEEASAAYDAAAIQLHGQFARTNATLRAAS